MTVGQADREAWDGGLPELHGDLRAVVEELGVRARVHDLYDPVGARMYDDTVTSDPSEIRELSRLLRATSGPVLELAAGSGRLTLPLLRTGREVTALELSATMVELLRRRVDDLPERQRSRLRVVREDMSDFHLDERFGVVVLGTSSVSLLSEEGRRRLFDRVRDHLLPDGTFLMSVAEVTDPGQAPASHTMEVTGLSGRRYRMFYSWQPGGGHRQVGVHALPVEGDEVPVAVSRPAVIRSAALGVELDAAGLSVRARHPVASSWPGFEEAFLEVTRRST